jgi:DNA-binding response OmpR family regulator
MDHASRTSRDADAAATDVGIRLLVVEDEPALRRIYARVLRAKGYEIIEAEDGEGAIAKFNEDAAHIALAILDVRLPGLSGPAAYARMQQERTDLPVLFVTGHAFDSDEIPIGAPLLLKPFSHDALVAAVESACRRAEARSV